MLIAKCTLKVGKSVFKNGDEITAKLNGKEKERLIKAKAITEIGNKTDSDKDENKKVSTPENEDPEETLP